MASLDELFQLMVDEGASDLHVSSGYAPFFRINGHMIRLETAPLSSEKCQKAVYETMSEDQIEVFENTLEMDWSYHIEGLGRFRANAFVQDQGVGAVYRHVPDQIRTMKALMLPNGVQWLAEQHKGLILVTGPTGSGKSTTLASILNYINQNRMQHIITIEDPIEYKHKGINCLINQREVSRHTKSFSTALRAALREDPDIILVGEMRDLETMSLALTAAETGHLVLATLHTNSAAKSIDRIISSFPHEQQSQIRTMLSESLVGVLAQILIPKIDNKGMVPGIELLIANSAVRHLIRENKIFQIPGVIQTSATAGMISFEQSIKTLVSQGLISEQTATKFLPTKLKSN